MSEVYKGAGFGECLTGVDVDGFGYHNTYQEVVAMLQKVLTANYPKVRKGLFVFPINFFVQIFWDSLIKPVLSTLQPDIEYKISPLTNDWKLEWRKRFDLEQTEIEFGGLLDVRICSAGGGAHQQELPHVER